MGRRPLLAVAALALAAAVAACDSSLPTAPESLTTLTTTVEQPGAPAGVLTVRHDACACTGVALEVRIDWVFVGTVECGATGEFALPAHEFELQLAAGDLGTRLRLGAASEPAGGVALAVRCAAG